MLSFASTFSNNPVTAIQQYKSLEPGERIRFIENYNREYSFCRIGTSCHFRKNVSSEANLYSGYFGGLYFKDGKILKVKAPFTVTYSLEFHNSEVKMVENKFEVRDGIMVLFTGVDNERYYIDGDLIRGLDKEDLLYNGLIYKFKEGQAKLFTGIYKDGNFYKDGSILTGGAVEELNGLCWTFEHGNPKDLFTGVFNNSYYVKGKKYEGRANIKEYAGFLYKVKKDGSVQLFEGWYRKQGLKEGRFFTQGKPLNGYFLEIRGIKFVEGKIKSIIPEELSPFGLLLLAQGMGDDAIKYIIRTLDPYMSKFLLKKVLLMKRNKCGRLKIVIKRLEYCLRLIILTLTI